MLVLRSLTIYRTFISRTRNRKGKVVVGWWGGGAVRRGERIKGKWGTGATKDNDKLKKSTLIFPYVG